MSAQFIRVDAISAARAAAIIGEADRQPEFSCHVEHSQAPKWAFGSAERVRQKVDAFMATPCTYTDTKGVRRQRQRRSDYRCLLAGVVSFPIDLAHVRSLPASERIVYSECFRAFAQDTMKFLGKEFGEDVVAVVIHLDESHPHLHFFAVGDCRNLHPGLKAEYVDGVRLKSRVEKTKRYNIAMRTLLDDFFTDVAAKHGLERRVRAASRPRTRDQAIAKRIAELERKVESQEHLRELDEIKDLAAARQTKFH